MAGKASLRTQDAIDVGLGIQPGKYEVIDSEFGVAQFQASKKTGEQSGPFTALILTVKKLDANLKPTNDDPIIEPISFGNKSIGATAEDDTWHPGMGKTEDDEEPLDCGREIGAKGNTLYSVRDGGALNKKSKAMMFIGSLENKGFNPEVLRKCWAPSFIGLQFEADTETHPGINGGAAWTSLTCKAIMRYPYQDGGTRPASPAAPVARGNTVASTPAAPTVAAAPAVDVPALLFGILTDYVMANPGLKQPWETFRAKLLSAAATASAKDQELKKNLAPIMVLARDRAHITSTGMVIDSGTTIDIP